MKKHDEGYVMILVVVVILVLSIVSAALMSLGVTNMKNQAASINRMKDKYSAQGEVEKIVAALSIKTMIEYNPIEDEPAANADSEAPSESETEEPEEDTDQKTEDEIAADREAKKKAVTQWIKNVTGLDTEVVIDDEDKYNCSISLACQSESGKTQIDCVLFLSGTITDETEDEIVTIRKYVIEPNEVVYKSYIIYTTSEGGDS